MGTDLALLPLESESAGNAFSHSILECIRRRELFDDLRELEASPVPEPFYTYRSCEGGEESHYGDTQTDGEGEPLTKVRVLQLLPFASHESVRDTPRNKAIWAYLAALPPRTWVALYWY